MCLKWLLVRLNKQNGESNMLRDARHITFPLYFYIFSLFFIVVSLLSFLYVIVINNGFQKIIFSANDSIIYGVSGETKEKIKSNYLPVLASIDILSKN